MRLCRIKQHHENHVVVILANILSRYSCTTHLLTVVINLELLMCKVAKVQDAIVWDLLYGSSSFSDIERGKNTGDFPVFRSQE